VKGSKELTRWRAVAGYAAVVCAHPSSSVTHLSRPAGETPSYEDVPGERLHHQQPGKEPTDRKRGVGSSEPYNQCY
jgi:hypothetical protein